MRAVLELRTLLSDRRVLVNIDAIDAVMENDPGSLLLLRSGEELAVSATVPHIVESLAQVLAG